MKNHKRKLDAQSKCSNYILTPKCSHVQYIHIFILKKDTINFNQLPHAWIKYCPQCKHIKLNREGGETRSSGKGDGGKGD